MQHIIQNNILEKRGVLEGHGGWVTSLSVAYVNNQKILLSGSRDKKLMLWDITDSDLTDSVGTAKKSLTGHGHFISDVIINSDGQYAISGSWDTTLRLWDLNSQKCIKLFIGHEKSVFSVAFSKDNRQILSGGRDNKIILWNTLAQSKSIIDQAHNGWVSCVKFSPAHKLMVSCGWDAIVSVWNLENCQIKTKLVAHTEPLSSVSVSPDGSLCASGGLDGIAMLWDVIEGKHLYSLESQQPIQQLCFSPSNYWLCASTSTSIIIWDLENKNVIEEIKHVKSNDNGIPWCTSLTWMQDGKTLLAGSSDGNIYVYNVK